MDEYDVLVTMDRSIEFQHRVAVLPFDIVVVRARSNRMQDLKPLVPLITAAIDAITAGRSAYPPDQRFSAPRERRNRMIPELRAASGYSPKIENKA
jgi:hypothetical protein